MGPYFEAQNSRLDSLELTIRHLQQRNEIFEDGLANIRGSLVDASRGAPRNRDQEQSATTTPETSGEQQNNATTYLLAVHESLRDEITNLSHAITDLDARASMAIMNECLRIKEDMAHTNAAVNSVRMQVQWLMNPRLHGQRVVRGTASPGTSPSGNSAASGSADSGPSDPSPGALRPRRLSDSGREGTKL